MIYNMWSFLLKVNEKAYYLNSNSVYLQLLFRGVKMLIKRRHQI